MTQSTAIKSQRRSRNKQWFQALALANQSKQDELSLHWRNALVSENLALVRQVANRLSKQTGQPFDELVSAGSLGLIRAVEAFDLQRDCGLSTFAVPYIRGAMLHDQRDNHQPLKTPRRLRELHQRARRLEEQRRRQGAAPLGAAELAEALNCRLEQLEEAKQVQRALKVLSLDAPSPGGHPSGGEGPCLVDQIAAPETSDGPSQAQRSWLECQLKALSGIDRALLQGHWMLGRSWKELGLQLRMGPKQAQARAEAALNQLRHNLLLEAQQQEAGHGDEGRNRGLQAIHQFIGEPAEAVLAGCPNHTFNQGGHQSHQGHEDPPHRRWQ
jgi:RNA polymerase sigma-B factor